MEGRRGCGGDGHQLYRGLYRPAGCGDEREDLPAVDPDRVRDADAGGRRHGGCVDVQRRKRWRNRRHRRRWRLFKTNRRHYIGQINGLHGGSWIFRREKHRRGSGFWPFRIWFNFAKRKLWCNELWKRCVWRWWRRHEPNENRRWRFDGTIWRDSSILPTFCRRRRRRML